MLRSGLVHIQIQLLFVFLLGERFERRSRKKSAGSGGWTEARVRVKSARSFWIDAGLVQTTTTTAAIAAEQGSKTGSIASLVVAVGVVGISS